MDGWIGKQNGRFLIWVTFGFMDESKNEKFFYFLSAPHFPLCVFVRVLRV